MHRFSIWLETRTLCPKPRDIVRAIPKIWNQASASIAGWPERRLTRISFKVASDNLAWSALEPNFRAEAEAYLQMRAEPDLFDTDPAAPKRPLAPRSVLNQREHIRLAASIQARDASHGSPVSLAHLVSPQALKAVLRHYHAQAEGKPSSQAIGTGKTMIDIARYHAKLPDPDLRELKAIAGRLPPVDFDLSEKNKQLLRLLECEDTRARLLFLPQRLIRRAKQNLQNGHMDLVEAQVAIAVDILLVAPLRLQNLIALASALQGDRWTERSLTLYIPKQETKTGKRELVFELPEEVAEHIRWYPARDPPACRQRRRGSLHFPQGRAERPSHPQGSDYRGDRRACRRAYDAASVPALRGGSLPGRASRELPDRHRSARPFLG